MSKEMRESHELVPSDKSILSKKQVADRWSMSVRTVDRLRESGRLEWLDLAAGIGARPIVRFRLRDVEDYENRNFKSIRG